MKDIERQVKEKLGLDVPHRILYVERMATDFTSNKQICQTFFEKIDLIDSSTKLVCVPLPFHNIIYKLHHKMELVHDDMFFIYEKMLCPVYRQV